MRVQGGNKKKKYRKLCVAFWYKKCRSTIVVYGVKATVCETIVKDYYTALCIS